MEQTALINVELIFLLKNKQQNLEKSSYDERSLLQFYLQYVNILQVKNGNMKQKYTEIPVFCIRRPFSTTRLM